MSSTSLPASPSSPLPLQAAGTVVFGLLLACGLGYAGYSLYQDLSAVPPGPWLAYLLLGVALLIALGFEFVNGFHDTANAVATVIYTHALQPGPAVVWSGLWNFAGVLVSTGTVAYGIISLLPVELILHVGSSAGFAMVFALLIAAIIWNLSTWWLGLPSSSSHTLIGSIIGVGLANQLMSARSGTSGVDWDQALGIGKSLLVSPLVGFFATGALLLLAKALLKIPALYRAPEGNQPPPWPIRLLLIFTCTSVSFGHGSNDGQKGMGLIMLILIGTVPTAYALNHAVPGSELARFSTVSAQAAGALSHYLPASAAATQGDPRPQVTALVAQKQGTPEELAALRTLIGDIAAQVRDYGTLNRVPPAQVGNVRNDMYLTSESLRLIEKQRLAHKLSLSQADAQALVAYHASIDHATKFIPTWVKVVVALALGLGTMVGWKRIVVTVGEKIGKTHLSYGQGAAAELVAAATIFAADHYGLPVSTTHVLSSGVAGAMAANRSGLQGSTVRNLVLAWVLTLPASILLAGILFWLLRHLF